MKTFANKINLPAILTLILGLGLMSGSFAQRTALAGRIDNLPALQVTVPKSLKGQYLHVLYAVGRPGFLGVSPIPYLDIIRPQSQAILIESETVQVPAVNIEKTPGRGSYNMIVLAVSPLTQIKWANVDVNPDPADYTFLHVLQKPQVDAFLAKQTEAKALPVSLQ